MKTILFTLSFICLTQAELYLDEDIKLPIDTDLHKRVLDRQQCQKQLLYLRQNNSLLLARFLDAGMRVPRGILLGNLMDLGNYRQCLGIHDVVAENMSIEGKFCMIKVPVDRNLQSQSLSSSINIYDLPTLELRTQSMNILNEHKSQMKKIIPIFRHESRSLLMDTDTYLKLKFQLAICIPKVCTTEETINGLLLFNLTELGFNYADDFCRVKNDKPWTKVDQVAIIIFSILGFTIVLSTYYDVHQNIIFKKDPKEVSDILISFSALTNCRRLLVFESNSNQMQCLDGIRSLAIFWVVFGHVFYITIYFLSNPIESLEWTQSFESIWLTTATLTVDTFFLLSGLLLMCITARKFTGFELIKNLPVFYLNRLVRLFPILAVVVLYETSLFNHVGDGPLWHELALQNVQNCRKFWWTTLIHMQNFLNPLEACVGVSWYLAIDTQLHILSPIVLFWVLGRSRVSAWIALTTALVVSLAASTAYIFSNEFSNEGLNYYTYYYVNILTRASPFFVGLIYGYVIHIWRTKKLNVHTALLAFITSLSVLILFIIIYCYFKGSLLDFDNKFIKKSFESFLRPFWAVSLGWIIFACVNGYGGPINWFLSLNIWRIPARISYAVYLIHFSIIIAVYSSKLQQIYFTVGSTVFDAFGFLWLSLFVGFFVTALIDTPFAILFKKLLERASINKRSANKGIIEESN